ncbi:MBOAT family protein [Rickettsiales bacterium]|nr:MBOAT family protein [Rickettsiales bacterium]MDB2550554.1 MBOAT family protein [Rickettsiales bacterium]
MINYFFGNLLIKQKNKIILIIAVIFNISLLAYFKYCNFFLDNIAIFYPDLFDNSIIIILPLAISFFTFQQIAYIADCYEGKLKDQNFINYALFVSFFPQLIAGPIVHHGQMMPQFSGLRTKIINYNNLSLGLFIFAVGLFKKVVIADYLAEIVNLSYQNYQDLSFIDSWKASLAYTFQLYFDFSGYTDMAIGVALMFNIKLPFNFNSPYKSANIAQFWNSWHMTLSKFLKDYIYIPLGGNRVANFKIYRNLMIVFLISGLWHGAGWTFIFWGFLHGCAICIHRLWKNFNIKINYYLAWFITFNFINISWVFFRSDNFSQALYILENMFLFSGDNFGFYDNYLLFMEFIRFKSVEYLILTISLIILYYIYPIITKDSEKLMKIFKNNKKFYFITLILLLIPLLSFHQTSEFLYFNF